MRSGRGLIVPDRKRPEIEGIWGTWRANRVLALTRILGVIALWRKEPSPQHQRV